MGILDRNAQNYTYTDAKKEADTIVVAVVVGFAATRALLGQPFSFDMQDSDDPGAEDAFVQDVARWEMALDAVAHVVGELRPLVAHNVHAENLRPSDISNATEDAVAPTVDQISNAGRGPTITGRPGGEAVGGSDRWRRPWMNLVENPTPEYWGRGAYTGVADDPLRIDRWLNPNLARPANDSIANCNDHAFADGMLLVPEVARLLRLPTVAVKLPPGQNDGRYRPANIATWLTAKGVDPQAPTPLAYGEIHGSNEQQPPVGLSLAFNGNERTTQIIGYTHGMCQAIVESSKRGPWCVAHEHAIGSETTKLASCFACTTYMYAAGFPPSSSHLGRAESWLPPVPPQNDAGTAAQAEAINTRWHTQIFYYMLLGARLLQEYFLGDGLRHPYNAYAPLADQLLAALSRIYGDGANNNMVVTYDFGRIATTGGNLYLDALVHHDTDSVRIYNVLGLADADVATLVEYQRHLLAHASEPREAQIAAAKIAMRNLRYYPPAWISADAKRAAAKRAAEDKKRREAVQAERFRREIQQQLDRQNPPPIPPLNQPQIPPPIPPLNPPQNQPQIPPPIPPQNPPQNPPPIPPLNPNVQQGVNN